MQPGVRKILDVVATMLFAGMVLLLLSSMRGIGSTIGRQTPSSTADR